MTNDESVELTLGEVLKKLDKDLKVAAATLKPHEVRFLVSNFYVMQDNRQRADNQIRYMEKHLKPCEVISWLSNNSTFLENQIKLALDYWSRNSFMGKWSRNIRGVGPVIASGLSSFIDITLAPTVGHIWRYCGYDPTRPWLGRDKANAIVTEVCKGPGKFISEENIIELANRICVRPTRFKEMMERWMRKKLLVLPKSDIPSTTAEEKIQIPEVKDIDFSVAHTKENASKVISLIPWNADFKTLCWKIGESFVKQSGHEDDIYGKIYLQRKAYEEAKNENGDYAIQAKDSLAKMKDKDKDAYHTYASGKLTPGHIHSRAKRYAVKLFLSHWWETAYKEHYKKDPPAPYPIQFLGHAHKIEPPEGPAAVAV